MLQRELREGRGLEEKTVLSEIYEFRTKLSYFFNGKCCKTNKKQDNIPKKGDICISLILAWRLNLFFLQKMLGLRPLALQSKCLRSLSHFSPSNRFKPPPCVQCALHTLTSLLDSVGKVAASHSNPLY